MPRRPCRSRRQLGDLGPRRGTPGCCSAAPARRQRTGSGPPAAAGSGSPSGPAAVHRTAPARRGAGPGRTGPDPPGDDVHDQVGGLLGVLAAEPEKLLYPVRVRRRARVHPVRVDHDPGLGPPAGKSWSAAPPAATLRRGSHAAPPRRRPGQLVHIPHQQQVRLARPPRRNCWPGSRPPSRSRPPPPGPRPAGGGVEQGRLAARPQRQQPVRMVAAGGRSARPAAWPPGWSAWRLPPAPLARASSTTDGTVNDFLVARLAGQHRHLGSQREPHRVGLLRRQPRRSAGPARPAPRPSRRP